MNVTAKLGSQAGDRWHSAPLRTERIVLDPIGPQHYEFLRRAEVSVLGATWRHRGVVRSPEAFAGAVWSGVLCQYLALRAPSGEPVAWFQCYNADQASGSAFLAAGRLSPAESLDLSFMEAAWLFVEHVFDCWPFRKLVMEVPEFNLGRLESGIGDLFQVEGRLLEMIWAGGRHWDLVLLTLDRATWARSERVAYIRTRATRRSDGANAIPETDESADGLETIVVNAVAAEPATPD